MHTVRMVWHMRGLGQPVKQMHRDAYMLLQAARRASKCAGERTHKPLDVNVGKLASVKEEQHERRLVLGVPA